VSADQPPRAPASGIRAWEVVIEYPDGRSTMRGFGGRDLIRFAYRRPERVIDGPGWLDRESFGLSSQLAQAPTEDEMPDIVRAMLESQLGLVVHEEERELPARALVLDREDGTLGPNLRPSVTPCLPAFTDASRTLQIPPVRVAGASSGRREWKVLCGDWLQHPTYGLGIGMTMAQLSDQVRGYLRPWSNWYDEPPVFDETGLAGRYDVTLEMLQPIAGLMYRYQRAIPMLELVGFQSFPTALREQLGLRLENRTTPGNVLVIDDARRPLSH
jgi:uncharacterized protein (TIGR03435 family)